LPSGNFRHTVALIFLCAIGMLFLSNCKKDTKMIVDDYECPVKAVMGKENDIIGKWKLMKTHFPMVNRTQDHSCDDIVYEFRTEGIFFITQKGEDHETLTSSYELVKQPYLGHVGSFTLKIDHLEQACSIAKESMVLDDSPLDGPIKTFVRIE